MDRWTGKTAVVTGASAGIGAAIARDLVKAGMQVVGLARRVELVEAIAEQLNGEPGKLFAVKCDVTKESEVKEAFQWIRAQLGGIDVLVNNAGISKSGVGLTDANNLEILQSVVNTNVFGLCLCTREAVSSMRDRDFAGHIVHINSVTGYKVPSQLDMGLLFNIYPASKFAVTALTETLRQELIYLKTKIKVTSISPGITETDIDDRIEQPLPPDFPFLLPEDVSQAVLYVLGTPSHVQVHELTIKPIGEKI